MYLTDLMNETSTYYGTAVRMDNIISNCRCQMPSFASSLVRRGGVSIQYVVALELSDTFEAPTVNTEHNAVRGPRLGSNPLPSTGVSAAAAGGRASDLEEGERHEIRHR